MVGSVFEGEPSRLSELNEGDDSPAYRPGEDVAGCGLRLTGSERRTPVGGISY